MIAALTDAGLGRIDCVQAHGTSTPLNTPSDRRAAPRARRSFDRAHVSSVKGAIGHWVAGAGALGVVRVGGRRARCHAGTTGWPTSTRRAARVPATPFAPTSAPLRTFAFGGTNSCI
jgi:hypothetical protein